MASSLGAQNRVVDVCMWMYLIMTQLDLIYLMQDEKEIADNFRNYMKG